MITETDSSLNERDGDCDLINNIDELDKLIRAYRPLQESHNNFHTELTLAAIHEPQLALARQLRQTAELAFNFLRHIDQPMRYTIRNDRGIVETEIFLKHSQIRLLHPNRGEQLVLLQSDEEANYSRRPMRITAQRTDQWNRPLYSGGFVLTAAPISDGSFLEVSHQSLLIVSGINDGFEAMKRVIS